MIFSPQRMSDRNTLHGLFSSGETRPLCNNGKGEIGLPLRQEYLYDMFAGRFKLFYEPGP